MRTTLWTLAAAALLAFGLNAKAHHGWGSYDASQTVILDGEVAELQWGFPHVLLFLMHEGERWEMVLAPPSRMGRRGLSEQALAVGTPVSLEGYVSTQHEHEMRAERITVNGATVELR